MKFALFKPRSQIKRMSTGIDSVLFLGKSDRTFLKKKDMEIIQRSASIMFSALKRCLGNE